MIDEWLLSFDYEKKELFVENVNDYCWLLTTVLGVPTFKKISSNLAGWLIFRTIFHEDFKNVDFINVGHTPSTLNFCPCSPRTGSATGCVGRSLASTGFVWSKNQEGYFCYNWKTKHLKITCQNPWRSGHP